MSTQWLQRLDKPHQPVLSNRSLECSSEIMSEEKKQAMIQKIRRTKPEYFILRITAIEDEESGDEDMDVDGNQITNTQPDAMEMEIVKEVSPSEELIWASKTVELEAGAHMMVESGDAIAARVKKRKAEELSRAATRPRRE
ncbi:unnamed protein product [Rhizoctonia solani]|uniref:Uncharacterized protein n=1 Tax=Rhizoctonia solani TaxID=456999 RepID=A0A8H2X0P1_9AGAM|nr:unnamed protein product [Rhizoctonia solani]